MTEIRLEQTEEHEDAKPVPVTDSQNHTPHAAQTTAQIDSIGLGFSSSLATTMQNKAKCQALHISIYSYSRVRSMMASSRIEWIVPSRR